MAWFEQKRWVDGHYRSFCGSTNSPAIVASSSPQPYRCLAKQRGKSFSTNVAIALHSFKLPVYDRLNHVNLTSVSKERLSILQHTRLLHFIQGAAWRLGHKISEPRSLDRFFTITGEVVDHESYIDGNEKNIRGSKKHRVGNRLSGYSELHRRGYTATSIRSESSIFRDTRECSGTFGTTLTCTLSSSWTARSLLLSGAL